MNDIFNSYFFSFLHPFQTQENLRKFRLKRDGEIKTHPFRLVEIDKSSWRRAPIGVSFVEALSVSWVMATFRAAYALLAVYLGLQAFQWYYGESYEMPSILEANQKWVLFSILLKVVLFPVSLWVYARVWLNSLKIFGYLIALEDDLDEIGAQIVNNALTAHTFLLIPVFGEAIFHVASLVYLYAGFRRNLELSVLQSLAILVLPLFFIFLIFVLFLISLMFLVTSLI